MNAVNDQKKEDKLFEPRVRCFLRKNGEIYIHATSLLRGIAGVPSDPFLTNYLDDSLLDLGNAILLARSGSLSFLERENYLDCVPPYYEWAGVENGSQFAKHTKAVSIVFQIEQIKYGPTTNRRGVWHGMKDKVVLLNRDSTVTQIAEQLLKSFDDSIA